MTSIIHWIRTTPSYEPVKWINMRTVEMAIIQFHGLYDRYPTPVAGLSVLVEQPKEWHYSKPWKKLLNPEMIIDGWGRPMQYRLSPPGNSFGVYSFGEDGLSSSQGEDRDDINSWALNETNRYFVMGARDNPSRNNRREDNQAEHAER